MSACTGDITWIVYLPYSLAFFALGFVMSMTARAPAVQVIPRAAAWWLCLFGFAHGLHEWEELIELVKVPDHLAASLNYFGLATCVASWIGLAFAGIELVVAGKGLPGWLRAVPLVQLLAWITLVPAAARVGRVGSEEWEGAADAISRYLIAFPGALTVAYGLFAEALAPREITRRKTRIYLLAAASVMACYSVFAVIADRAPFFPASWLNAEAFRTHLHLPVEAFRAIAALAAAGFISWASVIEAEWMMVERDWLREEWTAMVVHDIRQPLAVISSAASLLPRLHRGPVSPGEGRAVEHILSGTRRLEKMSADLLDASRLEARRLRLELTRVDPVALVREIVERVQASLSGRELMLQVPGPCPEVLADPARLEQVLVNLLTNANKYGEPHTPITVGVQARGEGVEVSVTNLGQGLTREEIARLFRRFSRPGPAERSRVKGLGLGLYITRGLVEAHRGRIWVESTPGQLTTFRFTLPVAAPLTANPPAPPP